MSDTLLPLSARTFDSSVTIHIIYMLCYAETVSGIAVTWLRYTKDVEVVFFTEFQTSNVTHQMQNNNLFFYYARSLLSQVMYLLQHNPSKNTQLLKFVLLSLIGVFS
jgi:hypothetical protein